VRGWQNDHNRVGGSNMREILLRGVRGGNDRGKRRVLLGPRSKALWVERIEQARQRERRLGRKKETS